MKYRMLTTEEQEIFNEDFKYFLIANGVTNEEWVAMNNDDQVKANQLVELFSDTVMQKAYEKIKFLEHRSKDSCLVFYFNKNEIELISLNVKPGSNADLSTAETIHESLIKSSSELTVFKTKKAYTKERESEIHEMIEQGCLNSSESFWRSLEKIVN